MAELALLRDLLFRACGVGNNEGVTHADLVSRTQGVGGDLCVQDFGPVFDDLAKQLMEVVALACDWEIPPTPAGETFDRAKTNVALALDGTVEQLGKAATAADCATREGWHYVSPRPTAPVRIGARALHPVRAAFDAASTGPGQSA